MTDFYKMDPADWDSGTARLSLEEEAAYLRIVNSIHKHKGPVPDVDRVLAGMFRTSTRKARSLISALVAAGKIAIEEGAIWNERARSDLVHRGFVSISRAENGAKGGRKSAEVRSKPLLANDMPQAIASTREEKRREEKKEREVNLSLVDGRFDEFWEVVPRKISKDKARLAYVRALRSVDANTIIQGMVRYAESRAGKDQQYTAHPASWLNAGRWADEPEPTTGGINGNSKSERRIQSWLTGASITPLVDSGSHPDASQPLLAGRRSIGNG